MQCFLDFKVPLPRHFFKERSTADLASVEICFFLSIGCAALSRRGNERGVSRSFVIFELVCCVHGRFGLIVPTFLFGPFELHVLGYHRDSPGQPRAHQPSRPVTTGPIAARVLKFTIVTVPVSLGGSARSGPSVKGQSPLTIGTVPVGLGSGITTSRPLSQAHQSWLPPGPSQPGPAKVASRNRLPSWTAANFVSAVVDA